MWIPDWVVLVLVIMGIGWAIESHIKHSKAKAKRDEVEQMIWEIRDLLYYDGLKTPKEIEAAIGRKPGFVIDALCQMTKDNEVEIRGKYKAVTH
jgi:hypothetical protein